MVIQPPTGSLQGCEQMIVEMSRIQGFTVHLQHSVHLSDLYS